MVLQRHWVVPQLGSATSRNSLCRNLLPQVLRIFLPLPPPTHCARGNALLPLSLAAIDFAGNTCMKIKRSIVENVHRQDIAEQ